MLFNTIEFWIFFSCVWLAVRNATHRQQNLRLLIASYVFYAAWDYRFVALILISTIVDYFAAHWVVPGRPNTARRVALTTSVIVNLSILGVFKYFDFFVESASFMLGIAPAEYGGMLLGVVLPVGISFYTFQTMSYTIDVYRGQLAPADSIIDFALYVSFFPQLVAGPIERGERLMPQIASDRTGPIAYQSAFLLIVWGLFKKIVIADTLAGPVDVVFQSSQRLGPEVYVAIVSFAFQIYCDFSGYTDIARGVARLLGFELMLNFNLPYVAKSPAEFWQRWHISLSTWLRDYLYIPLGGSRGSRLGTYRNLMLTMLLGGLWHGARMNFVWWGLYHGVLLVIFRIVGNDNSNDSRFSGILKMFIMFHFTLFGWLLFRVDSSLQLADCCHALLFKWNSWSSSLAMIQYVAPVVAPLLVMQYFQFKYNDLEVINRAPALFRTGFASVCLASCVFLNRSGATPFIYFQF